jgi:hypothetical protein
MLSTLAAIRSFCYLTLASNSDEVFDAYMLYGCEAVWIV